MRRISRARQLIRDDGLRATARRVRRALTLDAIGLLSRAARADTTDDPFHQNMTYFVGLVNERERYRILELGSRDARVHPGFVGYESYTGVDINAGRNVDIVGDVHELSRLVRDSFDVVYGISIIEHLAMPWKAVLEINAVMKPAGLLFLATHPTWPPHALPWDFWRFSASSFHVLLNRHTGFEILRCDEGLPGVIVPLGTERSTAGMHKQTAYLGVSVVARKIGEPRDDLRWDLVARDLLDTNYPVDDGAGPAV